MQDFLEPLNLTFRNSSDSSKHDMRSEINATFFSIDFYWNNSKMSKLTIMHSNIKAKKFQSIYL
jgi:hypothetical protein